MTAVGQPYHNPYCKQYFDREFGIWSFVEMVVVKSSSKKIKGNNSHKTNYTCHHRDCQKHDYQQSVSCNLQKDTSSSQKITFLCTAGLHQAQHCWF